MRMKPYFGSVAVLALATAFWLAVPREAETQVTPRAQPMNTGAARRGEAWFYQRCSICHMGRLVKDDKYEPMAPALTGVLKGVAPEREKAVRDHIARGSLRMPGFQHSFSPAEFDELIAYLKTL